MPAPQCPFQSEETTEHSTRGMASAVLRTGGQPFPCCKNKELNRTASPASFSLDPQTSASLQQKVFPFLPSHSRLWKLYTQLFQSSWASGTSD